MCLPSATKVAFTLFALHSSPIRYGLVFFGALYRDSER